MITGSCHCKSICFTIDRPRLSVRRCYCETCRKLSGSDYSSVARVARDKFTVTSGAKQLVSYESRPGKQRFYCSNCYSPIYVTTNNETDFLRVRTGLLDGDPQVEVTGHMWVCEKPSWVVIEDDKPVYMGNYVGPPDSL
ncbi:GFA family protein [Halomonas sp. ISL-60]|nr:GFA family protein [Halomonas sp. ISL-60]MBT2803315.1 GFA family protein [Halomonas sp. ISL-56]